MRFAVVLHDIRSIHNVGSIFRTADAAGAEKIFCCGITPSPLDRFNKVRPDFAKVALHAEDYVPWEAGRETEEVVRVLKREGYAIYAVEQSEHSVPLNVALAALPEKIAILVGSEITGLPARILALADRAIEIPMFGKKESLNVAVAFGIVAFGFVLGLKK